MRTFPCSFGDPPLQLTKGGFVLVQDKNALLYPTHRVTPPALTLPGRSILLRDGRIATAAKSILLLDGKPFKISDKEVTCDGVNEEVLDNVLVIATGDPMPRLISLEEGWIVPLFDPAEKAWEDHNPESVHWVPGFSGQPTGVVFAIGDRSEYKMMNSKRKVVPLFAFEETKYHPDEHHIVFVSPVLFLIQDTRDGWSLIVNARTGETVALINLEPNERELLYMGTDRFGRILLRDGMRTIKCFREEDAVAQPRPTTEKPTVFEELRTEGMSAWTGEGFVTCETPLEGGVAQLTLRDASYGPVLETIPLGEEGKIMDDDIRFGSIVIPTRESEVVKRMAGELFSGLLVRDLSRLVGVYA